MSIYVDIEKRLGNFQLKLQFSAQEEVLALLGASGCGKSLTLKCIAGIERPDRGKIVLDGVTLFDSEKKVNLSPQERHTGLLFQNYALFPNMTVRENIEAGARREKDAAKRKELVKDIVESFGLGTLLEHYPHQLSGGQQQRVALARMLVSAPKLLLLDEPFSALDSHLRFQLEQEVRGLLQRFGKSVILVSHDRDEVFRLADKIAVMQKGRLETLGDKREVFAQPKTRQAALLTGCRNISRVEVISDHRVRALDWGIELETQQATDRLKYIGLRMQDFTWEQEKNSLKMDGNSSKLEENTFECQVVEVVENPFSYTLMLQARPDAQAFGWEVDKATWQAMAADRIRVGFPKGKILMLKE